MPTTTALLISLVCQDMVISRSQRRFLTVLSWQSSWPWWLARWRTPTLKRRSVRPSRYVAAAIYSGYGEKLTDLFRFSTVITTASFPPLSCATSWPPSARSLLTTRSTRWSARPTRTAMAALTVRCFSLVMTLAHLRDDVTNLRTDNEFVQLMMQK